MRTLWIRQRESFTHTKIKRKKIEQTLDGIGEDGSSVFESGSSSSSSGSCCGLTGGLKGALPSDFFGVTPFLRSLPGELPFVFGVVACRGVVVFDDFFDT